MANFNPTPVQAGSAETFVLGTGMVFYDVDIDDINSKTMSRAEMGVKAEEWNNAGKSLGPTTGDGTATLGATIENLETNGLVGNVIGFNAVTELHSQLETTIQRLDLEALKRIMPTYVENDDGSITSASIINAEAYKNVAWLGRTLGGDYVLIVIQNAIARTPVAISQGDSQTAPNNIPVEFFGHLENPQSGVAPYKYFVFGEQTTPLTQPTKTKARYGDDDINK